MGVFISYSRQDSDFVDLLHRLLVSKGYDAWLDRRDISAGSRWDGTVEQAIRERSLLIVVLSPEAAASENVKDEWNYALDERKQIIPLYYRPCDVPMRLRRLQRIDFEGQPFSSAFKQLCDELGEPDNRPVDPIQLAKREGVIFISLGESGEGSIRIAFDHRDYPQVGAFLRTVWFTLLWRVFKNVRQAVDGYGEEWYLKDKITQQICELPLDVNPDSALLSDIGVEPGSQLEIVITKSRIRS